MKPNPLLTTTMMINPFCRKQKVTLTGNFLVCCIMLGYLLIAPSLQAATPKVWVKKLKSQKTPLIVTSVGRVYPNRKIDVVSEISGKVEKVLVDVGSVVKRNQGLLTIDSLSFRLFVEQEKAKLAAIEARLLSAKNQYERSKKLLPQKMISREQYENIEVEYIVSKAQILQAKVAVKIAEEKVKKTNVIAPFSGQISDRSVETGQVVNTGTQLLTLVELDQVRVKIQMVERDYVHLDKSDPVKITLNSFPGQQFKGKIDKIGIVANPKKSTFPVEVLVSNKKLLLKAGFSAQVSITVKELINVFLVPETAIIYRETGTEVFIVTKAKRAQRRKVKLGSIVKNNIQVLDGLRKGDLLIIKGQESLKSGVKVIVQK